MLTKSKVTEIFCMCDEFFQLFNHELSNHLLTENRSTKKRNRSFTMSDSEVMTILILFHMSGYRTLKEFYLQHVCLHMREDFPHVVSYNRFVELQQKVLLPLVIFIKQVLLGKCTGISFVDSTPLRVCKNQRIHCHKVFKGIAVRGKHSMGWFFGFKLHLIINEKGELLNFMFTPANADDREPLTQKQFVQNIYGKLCGDKGYISKELFNALFVDGIQLITKLKNNMKNCLMSIADKVLLRKRALIESVNDELKNMAQIEHSRHRSLTNFIVNLVSGLAAYCFFPKKPSLKIMQEVDNQLIIF